MGQGHRRDFYELKDRRFLGPDEFVEDVRRNTREKRSLGYDIPFEEIVSAGGSTLDVSRDLFYSVTRNRQGAWGRAVTPYVGRKWGDIILNFRLSILGVIL